MTAPIWDLDALFAGGVSGESFTSTMEQVGPQIEALIERSDALSVDDVEGQVALWLEIYEVGEPLRRMSVCASGSSNANTDDRVAARANAQTRALFGRLARASVPLEDHLRNCTDQVFERLCNHPDAAPMVARFHNIRRGAPLSFSRAEEALLTELGRDGIHAWGRHYDRISGRLKVTLDDGRVLSIGRAKNLLGHAEREVRSGALSAIEQAWTSVEDDCAAALTHIVGQRQVLNGRRGCDPVDDSLLRNRMQRSSLDAMLEASRRAGPLLERYFKAKAGAMGLERLGFEDLAAPMGSTGKVSWEHARSFVLEHFGSYQDELADLARRAMDDGWVEAEDRDGKRGGGYCAPIGDGTSRIFMTFGESWRSTTTLAHELGHAYHNWVLRDAHQAQRFVPSTLAETASILAENLVRDAALEAATDDEGRIALLDARLSAGASFMMNLPFRYDLERALYALRAKGELDADALCATTVEIQRDHYRDALSGWFPHFWSDKLHFFISHFAFYNYPYTFGYLFSSLVYQQVKAEGPSYHNRVVALLQRSGTEYAEPLSLDVLGLDLGDPDVLRLGWAGLEEDLTAFEALVQQ